LRRSAERLGEIPAHVLQHLEVSERQADRLARLIDNLLDVCRVMNRRVGLDVEAVDLGALARETVGRFQARAAESGTPLAVEPCEPLVGYFDRLKLEQVLGNLVANALKYGAGRPVTDRGRGAGESHTKMLEHMASMQFFDPDAVGERVYYVSGYQQ
jgi:signal transduction histidine kinase